MCDTRLGSTHEASIAPCSISWFVGRDWLVGSTLDACSSSSAISTGEYPQTEWNWRTKTFNCFVLYLSEGCSPHKAFQVQPLSVSLCFMASLPHLANTPTSELLGCFQHRMLRCARENFPATNIYGRLRVPHECFESCSRMGKKIEWNEVFYITAVNGWRFNDTNIKYSYSNWASVWQHF